MTILLQRVSLVRGNGAKGPLGGKETPAATVFYTDLSNLEPVEQGPDMAHLLDRAEKGDRSVLPVLRQVLDESPGLWQGYGDLSVQAQGALVKLAGGDNLLLCEVLMRKLAALKAELMGESPSASERLLADRIAACWLQVSYYDG